MKSITREQIIVAKRTAMEISFWPACPLDDDDGFDRLMTMKDMSELDTAEWGSIYLHEHIEMRDYEIAKLKDIVFCDAVRLLCNLCGVPLDIAMTLLKKTRTTEAPNGIYTRERYHDWQLGQSPGSLGSEN